VAADLEMQSTNRLREQPLGSLVHRTSGRSSRFVVETDLQVTRLTGIAIGHEERPSNERAGRLWLGLVGIRGCPRKSINRWD
jgi:hypothetical protein